MFANSKVLSPLTSFSASGGAKRVVDGQTHKGILAGLVGNVREPGRMATTMIECIRSI
jgi:hypothetical protein